MHLIYRLHRHIIRLFQLTTYVQDDVETELRKTPAHIAFQFPDMDDYASVIADIVQWTIRIDKISAVSFYDPKGRVVAQHDEIAARIRTVLDGWEHTGLCHGTPYRIHTLDEAYREKGLETVCLCEQNPRIVFNLVSPAFGMDYLAIKAQEMIQQGRAKDMSVKQWDELLSSIGIGSGVMDVVQAFPEPQLLLCFGPEVVVDQFPPWQLRLTEFQHVQSWLNERCSCIPDDPSNLTRASFLQALQQYANCSQRYGK
jgi:hypothetical protein